MQMPGANRQAARSAIADALGGGDALTQLTTFFRDVSGRELSPDALAIVAFLHHHGSPDAVAFIMDHKIYQSDIKSLTGFVKDVSAANAHTQLMEAQAKANAQARA